MNCSVLSIEALLTTMISYFSFGKSDLRIEAMQDAVVFQRLKTGIIMLKVFKNLSSFLSLNQTVDLPIMETSAYKNRRKVFGFRFPPLF